MRKRYLLILVLLLIILLRGTIFRACVRYKCLETIPISRIHTPELKHLLQEAAVKLPAGDPMSWAPFSQRFTADHLRFTDLANNSNADGAWASGQAHCVGYAALMGAVLQEMIAAQQAQLSLDCAPEVVQCRGDIYLMGFRLTGPDRPAFFRDHDYIEVRYPCQNQVVTYDPSLYDYLRIGWVSRE